VPGRTENTAGLFEKQPTVWTRWSGVFIGGTPVFDLAQKPDVVGCRYAFVESLVVVR